MEPFGELKELADFKSLVVKLASPEEIRRWSRGEITKPETINYRTLKPEKDGLFDERIFGPTKDWECYCGKYKRIRYKGVTCDKCGVEVTQSRVRRERMGHITLATPAVHVWFFKGAPSKISLLFGIAPKSIEQVVYFARYLVIGVDEPGRKKAILVLTKARDSALGELSKTYPERKKALVDEFSGEKEKIKEKIKDSDRLAVALSEAELNMRKKEALLSEEEKTTTDKTNQIFENLISLVRRLSFLSVLSEEEYEELANYDATGFIDAAMGAEAILSAVEKISLTEVSASLRLEIEETKTTTPKFSKLTKRLKLVDGLKRAGINPSSMILRVLPVLPPDLRPMVQLAGGRFATSDLNDLYRRVINRNNRLKHLIALGAPEIILRNEKRMLQEAVDSLIDASQRKAARRGKTKQMLRSLSDLLKGKQGRFRQNLLGKRVDYSGRSVIIVGPELGLNQCGLPKEMALEMFKPFVLKEMIARGIAPNVKSAKNMLERAPDEVYDILEEVTADHPVLLNRAPTLHKLSIQAFFPILIEGNAIRVHPAVCAGFNADFDGDQMAVHVPLSGKAIEEAKNLMLPEHNLLRTSDGAPAATPASKEMALGIYYLTSMDTKLPEHGSIFAGGNEAIFVYQAGGIKLRQKIRARVEGKIIETTAGRIIFNEVLPEGFEFVNEPVSSTIVKKIMSQAYTFSDRKRVVSLIDDLKALGFFGGTVSGISFAISDASISKDKEGLLAEAEGKITHNEENFRQGLITSDELRRLNQQVWIETTEELADKTWEAMDAENPIKTVIEAKVGRASRDQVKQLAAIRGLVVDPLGKIVELPIKSNFREGLSVFEYVTSSRGSRKGLTDTAIKTADAGYLTRRLADVAHDVIIREPDCGTKEGVVIINATRPQAFIQRLTGRTVCEDVYDKKGKKVIVAEGEIINESLANQIVEREISQVKVRSPLLCITRWGMCAACYGWDLSNKSGIEIGSPVGVIAAQSIGEPGTQLTLRTKHVAGAVGVDVTQGLPRVEELFEARIPKVLSPLAGISGKVFVSEVEEGWKVKIVNRETSPKEEREYIIPKAVKLEVSDGDMIDAGTQLASGSLDIKEILSVKGMLAAQEYLVNEIQKVYESQGIPIDDKHFEVIVRKTTDEVKIITAGDTQFLPGDLTTRAHFEEENARVVAAGGEPATAQSIVLGITRRSLLTESWLSAASFEQTTEVLTEAALHAAEDNLMGLKENVIIGRLIPVTPERAVLVQKSAA